jgi:aquaporin Z
VSIGRRLGAEAFGTFWLVFGGCGSAVIGAGVPDLGIGYLGVALAFGLTVLTMAYAVGGISGGHFNPAVTFGLAIANKFDRKDFLPYVTAQVVGGSLGALVLYLIISGKGDFTGVGGFATNGYGLNSPGGFSMVSVLITEVVLTAFFLIIILGSTSQTVPAGFAPIAIGLGLTLIHLIAIPVSNTSVNPARSLAVALFAENGALGQVWLFWVAPLAGAAIGAFAWKSLYSEANGRLHRDVLQPETQACQERHAVARRLRTAAGNENRGRREHSGLFSWRITSRLFPLLQSTQIWMTALRLLEAILRSRANLQVLPGPQIAGISVTGGFRTVASGERGVKADFEQTVARSANNRFVHRLPSTKFEAIGMISVVVPVKSDETQGRVNRIQHRPYVEVAPV